MSKDRLFLLVEGQGHDVHFYDKLLATSPKLAHDGYVVHLGEQISIGGVAAGGKQHLIKLYDLFRARGALRQSRPDGVDRVIAFALDKDLDDIVGRRRRSPHVVYSKHADVEAEIFSHWRPKKALGVALSLNAEDAGLFADHVGDPVSGLADRWVEWVYLCCRAEGTSARCSVRFARPSKVNDPLYGPASAAMIAAADAEIEARARRSTGRDMQIKQRAAAAHRRGDLRHYVKGKLVPGYLGHLADEYFAGRRPISRRAFEGSVTRVALATIRFKGDWLRHWLDPLEAL